MLETPGRGRTLPMLIIILIGLTLSYAKPKAWDYAKPEPWHETSDVSAEPPRPRQPPDSYG